MDNIKTKSLKEIFRKYVVIIIIGGNLLFAIIVGLVVRNNKIVNEKNILKFQIVEIENKVYSKLNSDFGKIKSLSDILLSQLNSNRIYYQYNTLFTQTLSSVENFENVFIVFSKYARINNPELINYRDSVGRLNVSWNKNIKGIVSIDTINTYANSQKYDIVKSIGKITVFNAFETKNNINKNIYKTIVIPIYIGTNFIGVIGYTINTSFVSSILAANRFREYIFIADEDGILLFDRNKKINTGKPFTEITTNSFKKYEQDIVHNKKIDDFSKNKYLFFEPLEIDFFNLSWKIGAITPLSKIIFKANLFFFLFILIFMIIATFEIFLLNRLFFQLTLFLNSFIKKIHNISIGEIDLQIKEVTHFKEINKLINYLEDLRKRLVKFIEIHSQIKRNEELKKLESLGNNDLLASSINSTIDTIVERDRVRENASENKRKNEWINDGLILIHEASKIDENSIKKLADSINEKLSVYTNAFISTIFIVENNKDSNTKYLEAISTIGLKQRRAFKKRIQYGEGVVGTVALEKKIQYFKNIPDDYYIIVGGLSEMKPKSILVQPLEYEKEFLGIIEIAFLKELDDYELRFFKSASTEIALSIKNVINTITRNELLDKMKKQTTEIEKAKKLLENKINELRIKEKESEENRAVLQTMHNAVNNTLMTIEYSTSGILINANEKYLKVMNYSLNELKGVNVLDLVKSERAELSDVIKRVSNGEYFEKIMKRFTKYGEVKWLYSTYTPYYDSAGRITKVLYFAFDVTDTKKYSEKLEKEISVLKKQIKILRLKI